MFPLKFISQQIKRMSSGVPKRVQKLCVGTILVRGLLASKRNQPAETLLALTLNNAHSSWAHYWGFERTGLKVGMERERRIDML